MAGVMAAQAGKYVAMVAVQQLAESIRQQIAQHATLGNAQAVAARMLPGKRNKAKRRAAVSMAITNTSSAYSGARVGRNRTRGRARGLGTSAVDAPVATNYTVSRMAPRFRSVAGRYCVSNREFIADINNNTDFGLTTFPIQPGVGTMFPWLSKIAATHQEYVITKLTLEYVPVASTSERGRVTFAYTPDPLDTVPTNKSELYQYPTSTECAVWTGNTLSMNLLDKGKLFTRNAFVANSDIKTYDAGLLFVSTSDGGNSNRVGGIFVDYEVELFTPKPSRCLSSFNESTASTTISEPANIFGLPEVDTGTVTASNSRVLNAVGGNWFFSYKFPNTYIHFLAAGEYRIECIGAPSAAGFVIDAVVFQGDGSPIQSTVQNPIYLATWIIRQANTVLKINGPGDDFTQCRLFIMESSLNKQTTVIN